jgi:hypothetical protein
MTSTSIETLTTTCPHCGELVTSLWVPQGGCLSRPDDYVLVADWIFHTACWAAATDGAHKIADI